MKGAACTIPLLASVLRHTRALAHVPPNCLEPAHDFVDVRFGHGRLQQWAADTVLSPMYRPVTRPLDRACSTRCVQQ